MSRSLFLNAQRTERVQGPITWRPQTDHQKSKVPRAWGQHWRLPVRSALWAAAFFLGCLQGFPESLLFTPEDSLPKSSTFLAMLWLLLPLASYFSSLFLLLLFFSHLIPLGFWVFDISMVTSITFRGPALPDVLFYLREELIALCLL